MRIGLMGNDAYSAAGAGPFDVAALIDDARRAEREGFASYWIGQQFDWDAMVLLGALAREVSTIELGTAVTHIWTSFPVHMAQSAMSVRMLGSGRFTLGLGLEHDWVMRELWGLPFDRPVSVMTEYLEIVSSLLRTGGVEFAGEHYRVKTFFPRFQPAPDMQIILAALGPRMLRLAGTKADGTTTWMTGRKTIREHIVPSIRAAADAAARPEPRVVALLPVVVTADLAAARAAVSEGMDLYHQMPSYRAMLEREGVTAAGDIAIAGSADQVEDELADLAAGGATDLGAILLGTPDEREATRELLRRHADRPQAVRVD